MVAQSRGGAPLKILIGEVNEEESLLLIFRVNDLYYKYYKGERVIKRLGRRNLKKIKLHLRVMKGTQKEGGK